MSLEESTRFGNFIFGVSSWIFAAEMFACYLKEASVLLLLRFNWVMSTSSMGDLLILSMAAFAFIDSKPFFIINAFVSSSRRSLRSSQSTGAESRPDSPTYLIFSVEDASCFPFNNASTPDFFFFLSYAGAWYASACSLISLISSMN